MDKDHSVQLPRDENGFDGQSPVSDLTFDSAGNIYGTTNLGGQYNFGMVFELTRHERRDGLKPTFIRSRIPSASRTPE